MLSSSTVSLFTTALLLTNIITPIAATGINCDGAGASCRYHGHDLSQSVPTWFYDRFAGQRGPQGELVFSGVPDNVMYPPGYQIACAGENSGSALCLFTQSTASSIAASTLKLVLADLSNHGCKYCGSAPLDRTVNDVSKGMLTINVTKNPTCNGLCPLPGTSKKEKRAEQWSA